VNQQGKAGPLPRSSASWAIEESLDLDMVSAICPHCKILLVEAENNKIGQLARAEQTAVTLGARYVSNSWSGSEFVGQDTFDHYFNHPGDAIVFASGDFGYGAEYPPDLQYVTSVGGTTLRHRSSGNRSWSESAWGSATSADGTGSGCSTFEAKPSWQRASVDSTAPSGCLNRTENDVAAVANPATGVAVYDSYRTGGTWGVIGGTSVATPIITSVYALAGRPAAHSYPAAYPYQHTSHRYDVSGGVNGICESIRRYLCHGVRGYDGPTGLGTPAGTGAFSASGTDPVTLMDPGTTDVEQGTSLHLTITGLDTRTTARSLSYSATGLPAGVSISSAPGSTNAIVAGPLPATPGTYPVTITGRDTRTRRTGNTHFSLVVTAPLTENMQGEITIASQNLCVTAHTSDINPLPGTAVVGDTCDIQSPDDLFGFVTSAQPGGASVMTFGGLCVAVPNRDADQPASLEPCDGRPGSLWQFEAGWIVNPASGACLSAFGTSALVLLGCGNIVGQQWTLPAANIESGLSSSLCLYDPQNVQAVIGACGSPFQLGPLAVLTTTTGQCIGANGTLDGAVVALDDFCGPAQNPDQSWLQGPGGELINSASGLCLADPGDGPAGTGLVLEDCYGRAGEEWSAG
jgi:Ricin-type beta-trefoil lectin domain/Subtilase family